MIIVKRNSNFLLVHNTLVNLDNILVIKKFDKTKAIDNKYTIGCTNCADYQDKQVLQFIFSTDNEKERDEIFDRIMQLLV